MTQEEVIGCVVDHLVQLVVARCPTGHHGSAIVDSVMVRDPMVLLDEALQLPSDVRARLAAALLRSLDDQEEPLDQAEYDAAWGAVIERRIHEVETGAVVPVPWSEARRRIASEE